QAWKDLYASFAYHDSYLDLIAKHYSADLKGKHIGDVTPADIDTMPADARPYAKSLRAEFDAVQAAQAAARPKRVDDSLRLASLAWPRPLTDAEKQSLRGFYDRAMTSELDHRKAIRALLARILVSPAFLYRTEPVALKPASTAAVAPVPGWEMASRLSFF